MHAVNTKKNLQFEYIRAFSIIAVIAIHTFYSALLKYGSTASIPDQVLYKIIMNDISFRSFFFNDEWIVAIRHKKIYFIKKAVRQIHLQNGDRVAYIWICFCVVGNYF